VDEQLGKLLMARAKTVQGPIIPPHATIGTIFATEVGNLNHRAHKHVFAEFLPRRLRGAFVQGHLGRAVQGEFGFGWKIVVS